jgi:hypothetical protein
MDEISVPTLSQLRDSYVYSTLSMHSILGVFIFNTATDFVWQTRYSFVSINGTVIIYQEIISCKPLQTNSVNNIKLRQKNAKFLEFPETPAQMKPEKEGRLK